MIDRHGWMTTRSSDDTISLATRLLCRYKNPPPLKASSHLCSSMFPSILCRLFPLCVRALRASVVRVGLRRVMFYRRLLCSDLVDCTASPNKDAINIFCLLCDFIFSRWQVNTHTAQCIGPWRYLQTWIICLQHTTLLPCGPSSIWFSRLLEELHKYSARPHNVQSFSSLSSQCSGSRNERMWGAWILLKMIVYVIRSPLDD